MFTRLIALLLELLIGPIEEGDDLPACAGSVWIEGVIFRAGGNPLRGHPGDGFRKVRIGRHVGEAVPACDGGRASVTVEEGGHLGPSHGVVRLKGVPGNDAAGMAENFV